MIREQFKFAFHVMFHPFDGFWDLKYENKGRASTALILMLLLALVIIIKQQYTGFVVNMNNLDKLNSFNQLKYVIAPFFLWCVANWSTTTLMDGEGKFSEIVMVTGYALLPMVLLYFVQTLFSNVITLQEGAFYYFLDALAIIWVCWLLFIGTMTVHQYSVSKTFSTILLTFLVIFIILFIGLLFFSLVQQMVSFIYTIIKELNLRS